MDNLYDYMSRFEFTSSLGFNSDEDLTQAIEYMREEINYNDRLNINILGIKIHESVPKCMYIRDNRTDKIIYGIVKLEDGRIIEYDYRTDRRAEGSKEGDTSLV